MTGSTAGNLGVSCGAFIRHRLTPTRLGRGRACEVTYICSPDGALHEAGTDKLGIRPHAARRASAPPCRRPLGVLPNGLVRSTTTRLLSDFLLQTYVARDAMSLASRCHSELQSQVL